MGSLAKKSSRSKHVCIRVLWWPGSHSAAISCCLICSLMALMQCGYTLAYTDPQNIPNEARVYGSLIVLHAFLFLSALLLVIGMVRMNELLLCPYVVLETLAFLAYIGLEVALIAALVNGSWKNFSLFSSSTGPISGDNFKFLYITAAAVIPVWLLVKIPCLLCVVSLHRDIRIYKGDLKTQFPFFPRRGSTLDNAGLIQ
ncbi:uncharacterized protein LOC119744468 isoform X2 [Patiria miniata]|uniref:Uncharacterized protein n=1 Tax=Patiria miniata TaxID=46514 RepID=A0A914BLJ6_PATMI|nr:uncharacterized protein LOC119744468 isoform X2 [Patiria miniata]